MHYYGTFNEYTPDEFPEGMPDELAARVMWLRNEFGEDLYELRKRLPDGHFFITTHSDGHIRVIHDDPHHVWPSEGGMLYGTSDQDVPRDMATIMTKRFDHAMRQIVERPVQVPHSVSKAQVQIALYNAGLLDDLEVIIATHPYRLVRIWYEGANQWERTHPYVAAFGVELGLTDEQIDDLFIKAASL